MRRTELAVCAAAAVAVLFGILPGASQVAVLASTPTASPSATATVNPRAASCAGTHDAALIMTPEKLADPTGHSMDGPTIIRVPQWVTDPLGRYYLYFADHNGTYIRMAYADHPRGPFTIYKPGIFTLAAATPLDSHIASPDVYVDEANHRVYLSVHGQDPTSERGQYTVLASGTDGIHFTLETGLPEGPYFAKEPYVRVFDYKGMVYQITPRDGIMFFRSDTITGLFEPTPRSLGFVNTRHLSVVVEGDILHIYFTRVGDSPEHILHTTVALNRAWGEWTASPIDCIRFPEESWEGADLVPHPSQSSSVSVPVNQLRDPFVLVTGAVREIYYSVAGEHGIGVATLTGR